MIGTQQPCFRNKTPAKDAYYFSHVANDHHAVLAIRASLQRSGS